MAKVKESDLIGIGKKYQIDTDAGERIIVVIHDDGRRELYRYDEEENESRCVMTLSDEESRQVAGIIGGLSYQPKALETVELGLDDLKIEWIKVEATDQSTNKTIGELEVRKQTGASIIAAIDDGESTINPGPDYVIRPGITLVVAGKRNHIRLLKEII